MTEVFNQQTTAINKSHSSVNQWIYLFMSGLFMGLVSSQSLMDLFIFLVSSLSLGLIIKKKDLFILSSLSQWMYIALSWLIVTLIGIKLQAPPEASIKSLLGDFVWIIHLPLWVYLWTITPINRKWFLTALSILSTASLFAIVVYFIGFDPFHQHWADRIVNAQAFWRSGGFFSNAMALAQSYGPLVMILMPLSLYYLYQAWSKLSSARKKQQPLPWKDFFSTTLSWFVPLTFILITLAVLFTFTRGVWLALVITTILGSFIWSRKLGVIVLLLIVLGAGGLLGVWPKLRERTFQVFDAKTSYDSERLVLWKTNWHIFTEHPIMGIGYGENKRRLREFYDRLDVPQWQFEGHAHNQYLHILAGTGLIGLSFYLFWCFSFLRMNYRIYKKFSTDLLRKTAFSSELSLFFFGLFLAQIAFHIGSFTESNFIIAKNRMLLVFIWSLVLYFNHKLSSTTGVKPK